MVGWRMAFRALEQHGPDYVTNKHGGDCVYYGANKGVGSVVHSSQTQKRGPGHQSNQDECA